jgi:hypothetical protein
MNDKKDQTAAASTMTNALAADEGAVIVDNQPGK